MINYDSFLYKHVDLNNNKGMQLMQALDESAKYELSDKIVSALYKMSVEKYRDIDFGEIPLSKGDIEKLKHFTTVTDSIEKLTEIYDRLNLPQESLKTIKESIRILIAYKKEFIMGFIQDVSIVQLIYNTIVLSIIASVTIHIDTIIDYLRTPEADYKEMIKNQKNAKQDYNILITNLDKFNDSANKGDLRDIFDKTLERSNFIGATVGAVAAGSVITVLGVSLVIVPILKELIFFIYNLRMEVSEYLKAQADFLEINIAELKSSNMKNKSVIIKKQEKKIKQLNNWANKFEIKFNKAQKETQKEMTKKISTDTASDAIGGFSLM